MGASVGIQTGHLGIRRPALCLGATEGQAKLVCHTVQYSAIHL